ncbi:MAG: tyrosine-protein phosphatase, partial [Erysipelotrichaceae bacterium]
ISQVYNLRELGGFETDDHQITVPHMFLRSDNLTDISQEDYQKLKQYGLSDVIDLRHESERLMFVDPFEKDIDVHYHALSLIKTAMDEKIPSNYTLDMLYIDLLNSKDIILEIFKVFAKAKGTVLFHCTAGKDRTGVITALLLLAMKVSEQDVIADYQVSDTYLYKKYKITDQSLALEKQHLIYSKPSTMIIFLRHLKQKHGNARNYLLSIGVNETILHQIEAKFLIQDLD